MPAELFKALGDPTRLTLLARLANAPQPLTVSEASDCCGVHLSGVSRHLAMLREAGVISAEKQGREVRHRLNARGLAATLRRIADAIDNCCPPGGPGEENAEDTAA
jgi:DNA-binding transcriptional ArsR family regulator